MNTGIAQRTSNPVKPRRNYSLDDTGFSPLIPEEGILDMVGYQKQTWYLVDTIKHSNFCC